MTESCGDVTGSGLESVGPCTVDVSLTQDIGEARHGPWSVLELFSRVGCLGSSPSLSGLVADPSASVTLVGVELGDWAMYPPLGPTTLLLPVPFPRPLPFPTGCIAPRPRKGGRPCRAFACGDGDGEREDCDELN